MLYQITGLAEKLARAEEGLMEKVEELKKEEEDRVRCLVILYITFSHA